MPITVLVTGGARGIGAATARRCARAGHAVIVNYRERADAAEALVADICAAGTRATALQADVADESEVVKLFADAVAWGGPIGAVVNCAGVGGRQARVEDFEVATLNELLRVNVLGTMICCREAARHMAVSRGGAGGSIVNVSSMAATIGGRPGNSAYAASKAAVDSFTIGFAKEVGADGIRVNAVRPGVTVTDMTRRVSSDPVLREAIAATIPLGRIAEADEVAAPIAWLLCDEASFVSGCLLDVSGGGFHVGRSTA